MDSTEGLSDVNTGFITDDTNNYLVPRQHSAWWVSGVWFCTIAQRIQTCLVHRLPGHNNIVLSLYSAAIARLFASVGNQSAVGGSGGFCRCCSRNILREMGGCVR